MSRARYGPPGWVPEVQSPIKAASVVHIQAVQISPAELTVAFAIEPDDLRLQGSLAMQRQLSIDRVHDNYRSRIDQIEELLKEVVAEAVSDFDGSEPFVPPADVSEDQLEMGLGYDT